MNDTGTCTTRLPMHAHYYSKPSLGDNPTLYDKPTLAISNFTVHSFIGAEESSDAGEVKDVKARNTLTGRA